MLSRSHRASGTHSPSLGRTAALVAIACLAALVGVPAYADNDSVVVFNEIDYHPAANEAELEWIELHNQMGVDVDIGGWSLFRGVQFTFPEGTVIAAGGYLVVAASPDALAAERGVGGAQGPWIGRLENAGERLELVDRNLRVLDSFRFRDEDEWPVAPDGSGLTLAKRHRDLGSEDPRSWTQSAEIGGTPGRGNFPETTGGVLLPEGLVGWWRFEETGDTASDSAGNNAGTLGTGVSRVAGIVGDGAVRFDDSPNAFIALGAGVNNEFSVTDGITVEALVRSEWTAVEGQQDTIFRKEDGLNRIVLAFQNDDFDLNRDVAITPRGQPTLAFGINVDGQYTELDMPLDGQSGRPTVAAITDGSAHHFAATYDRASGRKAIYYDGVRVFDVLLGVNSPISSGGGSTAYIGNMAGRAQPFRGAIDELAFWGRGLNATEIAQHHAAFRAGRDYVSETSVAGSTLRVRLSEVSAAPAAPFVEIVNGEDRTVNPAGLVLVMQGLGRSEFVLTGPDLPAGALRSFTAAQLGFSLEPGSKLFLYDVGRAAVLDAFEIKAGTRAREGGAAGRWLVPDLATPGTANRFALESDVVINELQYHARDLPGREAVINTRVIVPIDAVWRYDASGDEIGTAWRNPGFADGAWPSGAALLYNESGALPAAKNTEIPLGAVTFRFRATFNFDGDPLTSDLAVRTVVDDGAIYYLNGVEILRQRMPAGVVDAQTTATAGVSNATFEGPISIPTDALRRGTNTLAVEVHQATPGSSDVAFGLELALVETVSPAQPFRESPEEWIELHNRGASAKSLSGWSLDGGVQYEFPDGTSIPAGGYLVVAKDRALLAGLHAGIEILGDYTGSLSNASDRVVLEDARGNPADEVRYHDGSPWPLYTDGGGHTLELVDRFADNAAPGAWKASDESSRTSWRSYSYRKVATAFPGPNQWREFVFGLLDEGEVLIDDLRVVESPGASEVDLIANGDFESGEAGWRILGNHRHSEIIVDPAQPGNRVLRLVATGATEHMHNHIEQTLAGGRSVTNGREYEISFRARWVAGSPQLHTRLYFNRSPATTIIDVPAASGTPGRVNSTAISNLGPTYTGLSHTPAVPGPGESVEVRVRASDADGVTESRLWWSVDGGAWQSALMSDRGGGLWAGSLPGQTASRTIQFYVEARDGAGQTTTEPAGGRDSRALIRVDDGQARLGSVHNLRIIMTPADTSYLHETIEVMSNDRIGCTVVYDEREIFYDCGVRLKGSERGRPEAGRVGYNIRFPADHPFRGAHGSVSVDRSGGYAIGTNNGQDEILVKHMIQHASGIPGSYDDVIRVLAPRSAQNGAALLQMARTGRVFLASQFENGADGTVFEFELIYYPTTADPQGYKRPQPDGVLGVDLSNLGDDKEAYRWNWLISNNREKDDYEGLIPFLKAMSLSTAALDTQLPPLMDVDQWMRAFAMQSLCGIGDSYTRGNNHNLRIYIRPSDGRAMAFPWDWDFAFTQSSSSGLWGNQNLARVITRPQNLHLYYGHLLDIMNTTFNRSYMAPWTTHYAQKAEENYGTFLNYIGARESFVRSNLPARVTFAITTNSGNAFSVDTPDVQLAGNAWIDVRQIVATGGSGSDPVVWTGTGEWSLRVELNPGLNSLQLIAFDPQGSIVGTDTIAVTSSFDPPAPTLSALEPSTAAPGESVEVVGTGFLAGVELLLDGTPLVGFERVSATRLRFVVPDRVPGAVNVRVRGVDGDLSNTLVLTVGERTEIFLRGDANLDSRFDVSDAVRLLGFLFGGLELSCEEAADVDDDDAITVTDAIRGLNYLFRGGPPPPAPFPDPGPDTNTADRLGCEVGLR